MQFLKMVVLSVHVGCNMSPMKIISFNIIGLRGELKRKEVRRLILERKPYIVCIQEIKLE